MLSNLIELRALFKLKQDSLPYSLVVTDSNLIKKKDHLIILEELDVSIKNLFEHMCVLEKETIIDSLSS